MFKEDSSTRIAWLAADHVIRETIYTTSDSAKSVLFILTAWKGLYGEGRKWVAKENTDTVKVLIREDSEITIIANTSSDGSGNITAVYSVIDRDEYSQLLAAKTDEIYHQLVKK